jgi:phosphatidylglycerophosphatase C
MAETGSTMNVFDFDKTIYDGDCSFDFYFYNLKRSWLILVLLPAQLGAGLFYKLKLIDKTAMKQVFYAYFGFVPDIDERLQDFWEINEAKIKPFYRAIRKDDDIIISASPEFMLEPICRKLNVRLIASLVDKKNGAYTGKNCFGQEKVKRFRSAYPQADINTFYSDSLSDEPMAMIAKKAVLVEGEVLKDWPRA